MFKKLLHLSLTFSLAISVALTSGCNASVTSTPNSMRGILRPQSSASREDILADAIIIRERLVKFGLPYASVFVNEDDEGSHIVIETPKMDDIDVIIELITNVGTLSFTDTSGTVYLTNSDVKKASAGYDDNGGPVIILELTPNGTSNFSLATEQLTGSTMNIMIDGIIVSAPVVNEKIITSSLYVTGLEEYEHAKALAIVINSTLLHVNYDVYGFIDLTEE